MYSATAGLPQRPGGTELQDEEFLRWMFLYTDIQRRVQTQQLGEAQAALGKYGRG